MLLLKTLGLAVVISLSGCAMLAPANSYNGHIPLVNHTQSSIDALIKDGSTTKAQLATAFGYPVHENPSIAAAMNCKQEVKFCIYVVNIIDYGNSVAINRSVTVNFDENNLVKTHKFSEVRRSF